MRLGEPSKMQATINITPLVDVVLVLLIIFMVIAPQMRKGPDVNLPNTTKPNAQGDERGRILVSIDEAGRLWINNQPVEAGHFDEALRAAVGAETNPKIVIRGDAKLNFREVREVMVAIEQTGFRGVGLIAKRGRRIPVDLGHRGHSVPHPHAAGGGGDPEGLSSDLGGSKDPCSRIARARCGDSARPACGTARVVPGRRRSPELRGGSTHHRSRKVGH